MRYVNWGVVSRHSHAPILISLLLSNEPLHLFYRSYLQTQPFLLSSPSLPCYCISFIRLPTSMTRMKVLCRTYVMVHY